MNSHDIRKTVFTAKPVFARIIAEQGNRTLADYFNDSVASPCLAPTERREELLSVVHGRVSEIISRDAADRVCEHLRRSFYASTADHHGPVGHPFFLNSHLAQSAVNRLAGLNHVVVFAYGGISLNNSSLPRSLMFHDRALAERRLHFFSLRNRHHSVYGLPAYGSEALERMKEAARPLTSDGDYAILKKLITEVYGNASVLGQPSFSDQMSRANYDVWKRLPGEADTELINLEIEDITGRALLDFHLRGDTLLNRLLFDGECRKRFQECFDGIDGAWSAEKNSGTFLFWLIKDNRRYALHEAYGALSSEESGDVIGLEPETIAEGLRTKTLLPGGALVSTVMSLYYGLRCGGGFSQVNNLTAMKAAYQRWLALIGAQESESWLQNLDTSFFCGEFVLATISAAASAVFDYKPATAIDFFLYGAEDTAAKLERALEATTLEAAVDRMMGPYYTIVTGLPAVYHSRYPVGETTLYA